MPDDRVLISALRTARSLIDLGYSTEDVLSSGLIPSHLSEQVLAKLEDEANITLLPARVIVADKHWGDWLASMDRSNWTYWPALRQFLLHKGWTTDTVRSIDDSSDRVLRRLYPPETPQFDVRGLVLGYVQSGKTANFTSVVAKAADAGYRLLVVLSGIDNGLRRQTNTRLKKELVGYADGRTGSVPMPPIGKRWHEFTTADLDGDFRAGFANHAALQGTQPVLLVVKKNGSVLRRLLAWLDQAPADTRRSLPLLVIDDEADQASVDTRGSYQTEDEVPDSEYEPPSVINGLIRDLLNKFDRRAYVAYTATPFANILIPHDTLDPRAGNDLYPKDFIVDLPKPAGYLGSEEVFGRVDSETGQRLGGLNIIRSVRDTDVAQAAEGQLPDALKQAIEDFVLAGAARAQRGDADQPATMLIHTSQLTAAHGQLRASVSVFVAEVRDEWRYQRGRGIRARLMKRWEEEFEPATSEYDADRKASFDSIESFVGPFLEAIQVREVNSAAGEVLDYEREPSLKAIAVGGNRLSRGLTLEGLLVSFFIRRSATYDTLMQMGRWFGFRPNYEDLTRIWMTSELSSWFTDLAFVEHRLREDIEIYEARGLTPYEVGLRIWQHPTMQVTSPLKRRFSSSQTLTQSYSLSLEQTFKFPLNRPRQLVAQELTNLAATRRLVANLGRPSDKSDNRGPIWLGVPSSVVLQFLDEFTVDDSTRTISIPLIKKYIQKQVEQGELVTWSVAVRGRESLDSRLGRADWGVVGSAINQVSRSRLGQTDSVGVVTTPGDELVGLTEDQTRQAHAISDTADANGKRPSINLAARSIRPATDGLLLLYPISRSSGYELGTSGKGRNRLFDNPDGTDATDLIGIAISFPESRQRQPIEAYLHGTASWRPAD